MKKKKKNSKTKLNKKTIVLSLLIVLLFGISVGFAASSTLLTIEGVATVQSNNWSIIFRNLGTATLVGDAVEVTSPVIDADKTTIGTYDVNFHSPGDSVSYTFDVANVGTLNAILSDINISVPSCTGNGSNAIDDANNVCSHLTYTLAYIDGTPLMEGDTLNTDTSRSMKLTLSYNDDIGITLPNDDVYISNLGVNLVYSQAPRNQEEMHRITVNADPTDSHVTISHNDVIMTEGVGTASILIPEGMAVSYSVSRYGYVTVDGNYTMGNENYTAQVDMEMDIGVTTANFMSNVYRKTGTVTNNSITYDIDATHGIIKDRNDNLRYYGQNPDNYIDIGDNVLWRIIGNVDGKLKLIRSSTIGKYSWDTSASDINSGYGINEWSQADVMKLLNPDFSNNEDLNNSGEMITVNNSLWYDSKSGTCYSGSGNATSTCNFTSTGLKSSVKDKIATAIWYLGGGTSANIYPNASITMEKGSTVIGDPTDGITRTTTWSGKIGLPYPSDYGYATDFSKCSRTLSAYNNSGNSYACRGNNWLWYLMTGATSASSNASNYGWLLTTNSSNVSYAWDVSTTGAVEYSRYIYNSYMIAPTLYLINDLIIMTGSGTQSNPYKFVS